jgi:ABC-type Zn uptake system ZnuABC Zn-binding protein ZnuA
MRISRRAAAAWLLAACRVQAHDTGADRCPPRLRVLATTADLASLATAIAGDLVEVRTLVLPPADPESFEPRVRDLALVDGAALVLRVGLGFDGWLDRLLRRSGPAPAGERAAVVDVSAGIPLLEVHGRDPFARDGHPHGMANPHYWLDPGNAARMTATIGSAVASQCPAAGEALRARRERFLLELGDRMAGWQHRLAPARGAAVLAYHNTWPYFARRFHLNVVGFVEAKEGVTPSAAHFAALLSLARRSQVRAILQAGNEPRQLTQALAARLEIPLVHLAPGVGSVAGAGDYLACMEHNVGALAGALGCAG